MTVDPGWFAVGVAALALLQIAGLAQRGRDERNAREYRGGVKESIDALTKAVNHQNGRVGKLEQWRDGHEKWTTEQTKRTDDATRELSRRLDDSWHGPERRKHPRRGNLTEE